MKRLLLVEDDTHISEILRMVLENDGYQVIAASNLLTAKRMFDQTNPDAILLDYVLPDGTPHDFVKYVRRSKGPVPIILITAASQPEALAETLQIKDLLKKPFNLGDLSAMLQNRNTDKSTH